MTRQYEKRHSITSILTAQVSAWRMVNFNGTHAGASDDVAGISEEAGRAGDAVSLVTGYSHPVEAGGAVAAGSWVGPAADGTGRAVSGGTYGRALTAAAAAGELFVVAIASPLGLPPSVRGVVSGARNANVAPSPPRNVQVVAGDASAHVYFNPPLTGVPTAYTVTASNGVQASGLSSPITVPGLTNGVARTFSIVASNAIGSSLGVTTRSVTPSAAPAGLSSIPGLLFWMEPANQGVADGAAISTLIDSSGNGLNGIATNGPTFSAASFSTANRGRIGLDGNSQFMTLNTSLTTGISSPSAPLVRSPGLLGDTASFYIALQVAASTSANAGVNQTILSNNNLVALQTFEDTAAFRLSTNGPGSPANYWKCANAWQLDANGTFAAATPTILSVTCPGFLYVNGARVSAPVSKLILNGSRFGLGNGANNSQRMGGLLGRVLIYRGAHTQAQRWAVEAAMASFYNISVVQQ